MNQGTNQTIDHRALLKKAVNRWNVKKFSISK